MATWKDYFRPDFLYDYFFMKRWRGILGNGDAIVLVPYSDGMLMPKRGHFEKHLIGNMAGYETDDGDIYVAEGWGDPQVTLFGLPVVLALNPSEHNAVIDPMKSLLAHKRDVGQFVRVTNEGDPVEVGPGVTLDPDADAGATAAADGGAVPTATDTPTDINYEVYDGLFDVTPPMIQDPETGHVVDQADGWVVSQRKAADLVPAKTSSSELKLMQQRERNAMADAQEYLKYLLFGAVGASILWLVFIFILGIATGSMPSVV